MGRRASVQPAALRLPGCCCGVRQGLRGLLLMFVVRFRVGVSGYLHLKQTEEKLEKFQILLAKIRSVQNTREIG
jgi:hypothetical protein